MSNSVMALQQWICVIIAQFLLPGGASAVKYGQYRMVVFSLKDSYLDPLPRTNKLIVENESMTVLAQASPVVRANDSFNSKLVKHFSWLGLAPHLTLYSATRKLEVPFAMELYKRNDLLAWRCDFNKSLLGRPQDGGTGQWNGVLTLSQGSGFLFTQASLTDLDFVAPTAWPLGHPVSSSSVASRARSIHHLQDPCGRDIGLLYAVTTPDHAGVLVAVLVGNEVTWYDLAQLPGLRAAFHNVSGADPDHLSLTSAVLTSTHLFLLTSFGLVISPSFSFAQTDHQLTFTRIDLDIDSHADARSSNDSSTAGKQKHDELNHSISCFISKAYEEVVLLLLYGQQRFLRGQRPYEEAASWRDVKELVRWPHGLRDVRDLRYNWHWRAFFVGFLKDGKYQTLMLPVDKNNGTISNSIQHDIEDPFVEICAVTKKMYLLSGAMYVSTDSLGTFEKVLPTMSFDKVSYCDTDLNNYHVCVTDSLQLIVMSLGSDMPHLVDLKDIAHPKTTDVQRTALALDRAGGLTLFSASDNNINGQHFHIQTELEPKEPASCGYRLRLLGDFKHMAYLYLDVHDVVTVAVEARTIYDEGQPVSTDPPLVELELSNPSVVQVQRSVSMHNNNVRYTAVVRARSWLKTGVCALIFRLPHWSALCTGTSQVVNFALEAAPHRTLRIDWPAGKDPTSQQDIASNIEAGTDVFKELPVNYRPPSDLGLYIPISSNVYNADPSKPINHGLLVIHEASLKSAKFKQCAGKSRRADCGCLAFMRSSMDLKYSDCRKYVLSYLWPAKLALTVSVGDRDRPSWPLEPPLFITVTELNNRTSWQNHVLLDADLTFIYTRNSSALDRRLVDPQRVRLLLTGTGLYHFRLRVVGHASFNDYYTDLQAFVLPARPMAQVQNVIYPLVGISLIVGMLVVFEFYQQRTVGAEENYSESDYDDSSAEEK